MSIEQYPDETAFLERMLREHGEVHKIFLRELTLPANIGVNDSEKQGPQQIVVNVDLYLRPRARREDDIASTVDYDFLRNGILQFLTRGHVNLQETLVEEMVRLALSRDEALAVRASSEKRNVYPDSRSVGYAVFRVKPGVL